MVSVIHCPLVQQRAGSRAVSRGSARSIERLVARLEQRARRAVRHRERAGVDVGRRVEQVDLGELRDARVTAVARARRPSRPVRGARRAARPRATAASLRRSSTRLPQASHCASARLVQPVGELQRDTARRRPRRRARRAPARASRSDSAGSVRRSQRAEQRVVAVLVAELGRRLREERLLPVRCRSCASTLGRETMAGRSPARPSARCTSMRRANGCAADEREAEAPRRRDAHAALAEQPVDGVGRAEQQRVLAATPALVAAQHAQARRVVAGFDGPRRAPRRATRSRGSRGSRPAPPADGSCARHRRPARAAARTYSRACHSASGKPARPLSSVSWPSTRLARLGHAAIELGGLERLQRGGGLRRRRPDQRHPAVAQRQQRERPVRQEALPGRVRVRLLGAQVRDDRGLAVRPARASRCRTAPACATGRRPRRPRAPQRDAAGRRSA